MKHPNLFITIFLTVITIGCYFIDHWLSLIPLIWMIILVPSLIIMDIIDNTKSEKINKDISDTIHKKSDTVIDFENENIYFKWKLLLKNSFELTLEKVMSIVSAVKFWDFEDGHWVYVQSKWFNVTREYEKGLIYFISIKSEVTLTIDTTLNYELAKADEDNRIEKEGSVNLIGFGDLSNLVFLKKVFAIKNIENKIIEYPELIEYALLSELCYKLIAILDEFWFSNDSNNIKKLCNEFVNTNKEFISYFATKYAKDEWILLSNGKNDTLWMNVDDYWKEYAKNINYNNPDDILNFLPPSNTYFKYLIRDLNNIDKNILKAQIFNYVKWLEVKSTEKIKHLQKLLPSIFLKKKIW